MIRETDLYKDLTHRIIGAAIEVHQALGAGLLESAYEKCLCYELELRGIAYQSQVALPLVYKWIDLDCDYKMDIVVEDKVVLELKSVEAVLPIHEAQLITYLRLSHKRLGLLMNFNVPYLRDGIVRRML